MKAKRLVVDTKTGKIREEEFDFTPFATVDEPLGVDLEKLKALLLKKKIIRDPSEIE
jgi:hypothetical protein